MYGMYLVHSYDPVEKILLYFFEWKCMHGDGLRRTSVKHASGLLKGNC